MRYRCKIILGKAALNVYNGFIEICKLLYVHAAVCFLEVSRLCTYHGIFNIRSFQKVDFRLRRFAQIYIAIAAWAALNGEQRIEHIRVLAVIIPACKRPLRVVFRCIKYSAGHEQYVVQHTVFVVVRADNRYFACCIYMIIIAEFACNKVVRYLLSLRQLKREHLSHVVLILKIHLKEVFRLLDILNARLPEQIEYVALLNADIA